MGNRASDIERGMALLEAKGGRGTFDERKHPRDKAGRFASLMGGTARALGGQHGLLGRMKAKRMINRMPANERMEATERYISRSDREMLGMFKGDRLLAINRGDSHSVGPGPHLLASLRADRMTHNHPNAGKGDNYAWFSPPDINTVGRGKSLRVIDRNGNWQEMGNKVPKGVFNALALTSTRSASSEKVSADFMKRLTGGERHELVAAALGGMATKWGGARAGKKIGGAVGGALAERAKLTGTKAFAARTYAGVAGAYLAKKAASRAYDKYIEGPTTYRIIRDVVKRTGDAGGRKVGRGQAAFAKKQAAERRRVAANMERNRLVRAIAARQAEAYGKVSGSITSGDGRYDW